MPGAYEMSRFLTIITENFSTSNNFTFTYLAKQNIFGHIIVVTCTITVICTNIIITITINNNIIVIITL